MNKFYALIAALLLCFTFTANAQLDTLIHETFSNGMLNQVSMYGNPAWQIQTNSALNSSAHSDSIFIVGQVNTTTFPGDSMFLETDYFKTTDSCYVILKFAHIGKISFVRAGIIELSIDSGKTWTTLTSANTIYQGDAVSYTPPVIAPTKADSINSTTYPPGRPGIVDWNPQDPNDLTSDMWIQETFNISLLAQNQPAVKIRFQLIELNDFFGVFPGWHIDDIIIERALSELDPPVISHQQTYSGGQFEADSFKVTVDIEDFSATHQAWIVYQINRGAKDSIPLSRITPTGMMETWEAWITQAATGFIDGDSICYYVSAVDSSKSFNYGRDSVEYCFRASGEPDLTVLSAWQGDYTQISFPITADIAADGSGIASVICHYSVNGGPNQQLNLALISGTPINGSYLGTLDASVGVFDGDSVCYYVEATDASPRAYTTRLPDTTICWGFNAGGPPKITFPTMGSRVILGNIFTLGPFDIFADIEDGSGIASAFVKYTVNNGPLQTVPMMNVGGNTYMGTIPAVADSSEVCYYVEATDASFRANMGREPEATCRMFTALDGLRFPYVDDFEGSDIWEPDPGFPGWERGVPSQAMINSAHSPTRVWMTDLDANYRNARTIALRSAVFNFDTSAINTIMSFWQWRDVDGGTLPPGLPVNDGDGWYMEYTTDIITTTPTWTKLGTFKDQNALGNWYNQQNVNAPVNGAAWNGNTNGWVKTEFILSELNNKGKVRLRLVLKTNGSVSGEGVAIDDFSIERAQPRDAQVLSILSPSGELRAGQPSFISVSIRNRGEQQLDTIPITYTINGANPQTFLWTVPLMPGDTVAIPIGVLPPFNVPNNLFDICAYTEARADGDNGNDTVCTQVFGIPTLPVPHIDNFDVGLRNFNPIGAPPSRINDWEVGTPTTPFLNNAFSGANAWVTNLNGDYTPAARSWLYSPFFDFSNAVNMSLRFYQKRKIGPQGGMRVEFSQDFGFTWLSLNNGLATTNWYNGTIDIPGVGNGMPAFVGNNGMYEQSEHSLEFFNYRPIPIRFRFAMESTSFPGTDEGVAIDDFEIVPPIPCDVGVVAIDDPKSSPPLPAVISVGVFVRNYGGDTIFQIPMNYSHNGVQQLASNFIWNGVLPPGQTVRVQMPDYPSVIVGFYDFCAYTLSPCDGDNSNDTICREVEGLPKNEAEMVDLITPNPDICYEADRLYEVIFDLRNNGHSPMTSFEACYSFNQTKVCDTFLNVNIPRDSIRRFSFMSHILMPEGKTDVKIFVSEIFQDRNILDDTLRVRVNATRVFEPTYMNDFELGFPSLDDFCIVESERFARVRVKRPIGNPGQPDRVSWAMTFYSLNTPWTNRNAQNVWGVNTNNDYLGRAKLKVFTGSNTNLHTSFLKSYFAENNTQTFVRVVVNGADAYAFPTFSPDPAAATGNNFETPWEIEEVPLTGFYSPGDTITFEFQSKNQLPNGANIDSVLIFNKVNVSAGVTDVQPSPPLILPNQPVITSAEIVNSGVEPLSIVKGELSVNGTVLETKNFSFNPPLEFFERDTITFNNSFIGALGTTEICVRLFEPNAKADLFSPDDTLCENYLSVEANGFPYCNDFETSASDWQLYNSDTYSQKSLNWELGDPEQIIIDTAFSGVNAYMIDLDEYYLPNDSSGLYTPIFNLAQDTCYTISFYHIFDIDSSGDGGTIEYTNDGGKNWYSIGNIRPNWFNAKNIKELLERDKTGHLSKGTGWTGKSNGWILAQHDFKTQDQTNGMTQTIFRFRFASDESNPPGTEYEGWAIDDFCIEVNPGNCVPLDINELDESKFIVDQSYPNPTTGLTYINYYLPKNGKVKITIQDLVGKTILEQSQGLQAEGPQQFELTLKGYESGIYFYTVQFENQQITKKMMLIK